MELNKRVLDGFIYSGDKVIVACSGGADSMCLLSLMLEKQKDTDFEIIALHVNHNIRDKEADRDEQFVREFCKKNNVEFVCVSVNAIEYAKKHKMTLEQGARVLRYKAFNDEMQRRKANKIAVAHHKDDQTETVLMHIFRGSAIKGASGMSAVLGNIIRPLLDFSRNDIEEYNSIHNINSQEDSTNTDLNYTRNYIRHSVLPQIQKAYPFAQNAICEFAKKCKTDDDYIESMLPLGLLKREKNQVEILFEAKDLHPAIKFRLYKKAFEELGVFADIEYKHLKLINDIFNLKSGAVKSFPHSLCATKSYNGIIISKKKDKPKYKEQAFCFGKIVFDGFGVATISEVDDYQQVQFDNKSHYVDLEKIPVSAVWRTRKLGDVFAKLGSGSKKLNDYFTDKKVPQAMRDIIPVLAVENRVLVVAGMDISEKVKITPGTEQFVKISYITTDA